MSDLTAVVANALYNSRCLKFGSFKIKSGALSPYYIDLACLLSSPKDICTIADAAANKIREIMLMNKVDKLASIELKGALILPSIACRVNLPCVVVRKEEKTYGAAGRVAGANVEKGEHIVFFDDVISDGLSKLEGIKPLEELEAKVKHIVVVVDREQGGKQNLEKFGYYVHALTTISKMIDALQKLGKMTKEQADAVLNYVKEHRPPHGGLTRENAT